MIGKIGRIITGFTCWRRQKGAIKKLAIPVQLALTGRIIRLGQRSGRAFRYRAGDLFDRYSRRNGYGQQYSRAMAGTRPGAKSEQGSFFPRWFPCPPAPPLHYSITPFPEDSLQLSFPLSSVWGGERWPLHEHESAHDAFYRSKWSQRRPNLRCLCSLLFKQINFARLRLPGFCTETLSNWTGTVWRARPVRVPRISRSPKMRGRQKKGNEQ
jgi:hypothetical protein